VGAKAYAEAISIYLGFCVDKSSLTNTTQATWQKDPDRLTQAFARQAIPMTWDFAEANPFSDAGGGFGITAHAVGKVLERLPVSPVLGAAFQENASVGLGSVDRIISTDPPYYDNVGYADLSDYFYVWLRRSLAWEFSRSCSLRWLYRKKKSWSRLLIGTAQRNRRKSFPWKE
jgi:putative DNA methylase